MSTDLGATEYHEAEVFAADPFEEHARSEVKRCERHESWYRGRRQRLTLNLGRERASSPPRPLESSRVAVPSVADGLTEGSISMRTSFAGTARPSQRPRTMRNAPNLPMRP
jgi:hypothetical protein